MLCTYTLTVALLLSPCSLAQSDDVQLEPPGSQEAELPAAPVTHVVSIGELVLEVRAESRLEAGETIKIQLLPEAYSGSFEVESIARRGGRVRKGQSLLTFDDEALAEQIRNTEIALTEANERLEFDQQELTMMREANATRVQRAEKALADAEVAWELWETFHSDRMLRAANLSTRQRESGVLNQREELAQLQAMYDGAELESATKEIVLERATRGLAISEEWLDITQEDERITVDYTHGQRTRDMRDEVGYRAEALAHARLQTAIAEARKERSIQQATRSRDETAKRLEQLQRDRAYLSLQAPSDGLLARIDREVGDRVNARQVVAEIHDDSTMRLTFGASPNDLRVLQEGQEVNVRIPELPEVQMTGKVDMIETIGRASGKQTQFDVQVLIENPHEAARIGLNATIELAVPVGEVVMVPRDAVKWDDGRATVEVLVDGEKQQREVTLSASNKHMYQVVAGLSSGDEVVMPEKH